MGQHDDTSGIENPESTHNFVEFRIPSDPRVLKVVRAGVSHLCQLVGFDQEACSSTTLAVDEACSNIIKHTYAGEANHLIIVACKMHEDGIEIVLRDFGKKVDRRKVKSRNLDDVRPGGLGVHLINSVMHEVFYDDNCKDGNRLTLIRYLREKKEGT